MSEPEPAMSQIPDPRAELGEDATVVFVSGNFNVIHPGHVRLLSFARELGDALVVGVNPDTMPGVAVPVDLRLEGIQANKSVSYAFKISASVTQVIGDLRPDIVVKGREHENLYNPERDVVASYGGKLIFSSGDMMLSSISTLDESYDPQNVSRDILPRDYLQRHGITIDQLADLASAVDGVNVIVIGDVILDEYIDCDPLGMSQEDATIVVTPISERRFLGGAGIVAAHARGLGANVTLLSVVGSDPAAQVAKERLAAYDVECVLLCDDSRPTTLKQRYRALGKTLLRVSHLRQHAISEDLADSIVAEVRKRIADTALILFSDFNYGCLPTRLVTELTEMARSHKVMMAADSQASSQLADIARFKGMQLITPTELEARLALKDKSSSLVVISEQLHATANAENVIITLGAEGLLIHTHKDGGTVTDRLPALNHSPQDVAGAGDSLFCLTSLAMVAGGDVWRSSLLGAISASCQVSRVGNTPLTRDELLQALQAGNGGISE